MSGRGVFRMCASTAAIYATLEPMSDAGSKLSSSWDVGAAPVHCRLGC